MIRRHFHILLCVCGFISAPFLRAETAIVAPVYLEAKLPELELLLERAREKAPALVAQSFAQAESVERLAAAKSAYYPRFDINSTVGFRSTEYDAPVDDNSSAGANFYAVIRRPLYHWGAIEARIRQARLDQSSETMQRTLVLRQIRRGLRADYLTLLVNRVALDNLRVRRGLVEAQLTRVAADRQAGLVSSLDAVQLSLNQEQTLIDIDSLENDQSRILASYQRQIGEISPLALDRPVPELDATALIAWAEGALVASDTAWVNEHAEMQRRRNQIEREKSELVWVKSRQRPLLNASASALRDQRNVGARNGVDAMTYFAGVDISWNIFDGRETAARTREVNLRLRRVERQAEAFRAELVAQARDVLTQIILQARQLKLHERRHVAIAEVLKVSERDAAEGRVSSQMLAERRLSAEDTALRALRTRVAIFMAVNDYLDLTLPPEAPNSHCP